MILLQTLKWESEGLGKASYRTGGSGNQQHLNINSIKEISGPTSEGSGTESGGLVKARVVSEESVGLRSFP